MKEGGSSNIVERRGTEYSLMISAVIHYARATHSTGQYGERGAIQIKNALGDEASKLHDELIRLRHRAIAHVYDEEKFGSLKIFDNYAFLVETPDGWLPGATRRNVTSAPLILEALEKVLPAADEFVLKRYQQHLREVIDLLNEHATAEDLLKHVVDVENLFPDPEAARAVIASAGLGARAVILN